MCQIGHSPEQFGANSWTTTGTKGECQRGVVLRRQPWQMIKKKNSV